MEKSAAEKANDCSDEKNKYRPSRDMLRVRSLFMQFHDLKNIGVHMIF